MRVSRNIQKKEEWKTEKIDLMQEEVIPLTEFIQLSNTP